MNNQASEFTAGVASGEEHDVSEVEIARAARDHLDLIPRYEDRGHARPSDGQPHSPSAPQCFHGQLQLRSGGAHRVSPGSAMIRLQACQVHHEKVTPVQPSPALDLVKGGSNAQVFATASILRSTMIAGGT